jgi:hypothetical protein
MSRRLYTLVRGMTVCAAAASFAVFAAPAVAGDEDGPVAPECTVSGTENTIHGDNTSETIVGTPNDDKIFAGGGNDVVWGHGGNDVIYGEDGMDKVFGGNGQDTLFGDPGDDTVVGDHGDLGNGNANGFVNKDCITGGLGDDDVVGDNYAEDGDADGGLNGIDVLRGLADTDRVIGDNYAKRSGNTASGSGEDFLAGSDNGDEIVVGDNYAPLGTATGGSTDSVNTGPGFDLAVGDNYGLTTSVPAGAGNDKGVDAVVLGAGPWSDPKGTNKRDGGLHVQEGRDRAFGDNLISTGGTATGGGDDRIGGFLGPDELHGGPGADVITGDCRTYDPTPNSVPSDDETPCNKLANGSTVNDADDIFGESGGDDLRGRYGDDTCNGGADNDSAEVSGAWGPPTGDSCDTLFSIESQY